LGVVEQAHQGLRLGGVCEQAQYGQPDEKSVRRAAAPEAERGCQRVSLRTWKTIKPIEKRRAQQMEASESQLHLGFDAGGSGDPTPRRLAGEGLQQRGLPDARIAAQHEHAARPGARIRDQPIEHQGLGPSAS
jgi:hypothetical protein